MELSDKNLEKLIKYNLGLFSSNSELSMDDLNKVEDLSLAGATFSGEKIITNLSELAMLRNLKSLSLQRYKIDDRFIEVLNSFKQLKSLHFSVCEIKTKSSLCNSELERTTLYCCNFYGLEQFEPSKIFHISNYNRKLNLETLKPSDRLQLLYLQNCKQIKGLANIYNFKNIRELNLDGSKVDNEKVLNELAKKISVSHKESSMPIR